MIQSCCWRTSRESHWTKGKPFTIERPAEDIGQNFIMFELTCKSFSETFKVFERDGNSLRAELKTANFRIRSTAAWTCRQPYSISSPIVLCEQSSFSLPWKAFASLIPKLNAKVVHEMQLWDFSTGIFFIPLHKSWLVLTPNKKWFHRNAWIDLYELFSSVVGYRRRISMRLNRTGIVIKTFHWRKWSA